MLSLFLAAALAAEPVDHTDPGAVVSAIFTAAMTGDTSQLSALCDPEGKNDGDTRDVCAMTSTDPRWKDFSRVFATGTLQGEVKIKDSLASVPFLFGPNGAKSETMNLIRRDGNWYLASF